MSKEKKARRGRFSAPRKVQTVLCLLREYGLQPPQRMGNRHASRHQTRFEALEPIRQGVRDYFGSFAEDIAAGLKIRHDYGSQYMADEFQDEIAFLVMISSPSFVREPEGNGCAERFIRTLKENLLWVRTFETVEELRSALLEFKNTYNERWIIQRLGYQTPTQARRNACNPKEKAA